MKKHIDLFSGIGGFALAVDTVWPGSEHIFCDNDTFCQQVLKKHWPKSKIYGDIRTIANTGSKKQRGVPSGTRQEIPEAWDSCDILTGGFPCQPFSQAGRRQGTEDDRYLWPAMLAVIRSCKPTWVIAENVRGLATWNHGLALEQVCLDLEAQGYEVRALIIPAVAVNAPHRRDRIWFVAHRADKHDHRSGEKRRGRGKLTDKNSDAANSGNAGLQRNEQPAAFGKGKRSPQSIAQRSWDENWPEVAAELCRVDDGLPAELDGFKLTKAGHRTQRLKALGNSIVPQVAIEIMKAIRGVY